MPMSKPTRASKTDALSIRIDPRLRFGLELLARQQRRSVTGVVEWAIDQALHNEAASYHSNGEPVTFMQVLKELWSPNEVERIANLGLNFPDLMTFEETRMWRVMKDSPDLWADKHHRQLVDYIVHDQWEKLRPLLVQASERTVVKGLTRHELESGGIDWLPF